MNHETESGSQKVGIAMASYNPPLHLFRRQIESLLGQSHQNWHCVISDDGSDEKTLAEMQKIIGQDKRFLLSVAPQRLGFYLNFERSLTLLPKEAEFVALADQDDFWHSDKLQTLLADFEPDTTLVYSDMKIVSENGEIISETFWSHRKNNYTDLCAMLLVNSITGASSVFRRRLLEYALPFPQQIGNLHHDHWIGCLALATGKLKWVNRPLYDYVQHGQNVTGFGESQGLPLLQTIRYNFQSLATQEGMAAARRIYLDQVLKISALAKALALRSSKNAASPKQKILWRMERLGDSFASALWIALQGLKRRQMPSTTNGAEFFILMGVTWKWLANIRSGLSASRFGKFVLRFCPRFIKNAE